MPIQLCGLHCDGNKDIKDNTIFLFDRMCNVQCIELSHAQLQTTIQPLISHVTHCGWHSTHKQFPCTLLGQFFFFMFGKFFHITYPLCMHVHMYVRTYIRMCNGEKHFNRHVFHQLQLQTCGWRMSGCLSQEGLSPE